MRDIRCLMGLVLVLVFVTSCAGLSSQMSTEQRLERAWNNIVDQLETYETINSLTGEERIRAANKLVFGYEKLRENVEFFDRYAPLDLK